MRSTIWQVQIVNRPSVEGAEMCVYWLPLFPIYNDWGINLSKDYLAHYITYSLAKLIPLSLTFAYAQWGQLTL